MLILRIAIKYRSLRRVSRRATKIESITLFPSLSSPITLPASSARPPTELLEIAVDGRTWCGMCPLSVAAEAYVRTCQRTRKLSKCFHPTCFSFLHTVSLQHTFLPVHRFPRVFPSTKLSSINHDSHLHLSGFSPLRKIPTVNHYLRNQDVQQEPLGRWRVIRCDT